MKTSLWNRFAAWAYRRLDECRLSTLLAVFVGVVFAFGLFYTWMTPSGNGVKQAQVGASEFDFFNGLYFSVVTVSSLGYGDMQPVGYSRVAATIEVLIGLVFIGIMIAKLTSRPISHLISRVFVSATRDRLAEFSSSFRSYSEKLWSFASDGEELYSSTPNPSVPSQERRERLHDEFRNVVKDLKDTSLELQAYIDAEATESVFYRLVPKLSLLKLAVAIDAALKALGQFITSLPSRSYNEIFFYMLNRSNMQRVTDTKRIMETICREFMREDRYGKDAAEAFQSVQSTCKKVPDKSDIPSQFNPPDQLVMDDDDLPATL